ncbi:MFS transporter [Rhodococcus qingshengii]|uniref:MFS transporter n=1 Tax=Rhodococcus qingshengii TaxID=334542 RepID=UPI000E534E60|nr:MFS transporter [Rhodococcus qingshengii]RGP47807.1 MFS transporter [Rhodococcus erythropolis]THJ65231.1 MFS transporter [Rhodococcus qingshengii]
MLRSTKVTVALLFVAYAIDYIDRLAINLALPLLGEEFDLDYSQRGLIISTFFIAYTLAQLPGGLLADRYGAVRMALIGLVAWSVFTGLTALAWSFGTLLVVRFLFGLAQGVFPAAAVKLVAERSIPEQRATATGWMNSSNAVGTLLAIVVAAALLPLIGWRGMFLAVAALGVLSLVSIKLWLPPALPAEIDHSPDSSWDNMRTVLRSRAMWLFALMFFGYDFVIWGMSSWVPSYLHDERGIALSSASLLLIPATVVAAVTTVIGGRISDRLAGNSRVVVVPSMLACIVMLVSIPFVSNTALFVVLVTLGSAAASFAFMPCFALPLRSLPSSVVGAASSMIIFGGMVAGIVAPLVFGFIVDHLSWSAAFVSLALGPVVAIVAVMAAPQTREKMLNLVQLKTAN